MRELRSVVNGVFGFLVFLLAFSFIRFEGCVDCPKYVRMEVEEIRNGVRHVRADLKVPFFLMRGAARMASLGQLERELELHLKDSFASDEVRSVLEELEKAEPGAEVTRTDGDETWTFKKEGLLLVVSGKHDDESVMVKLPLHLIEAIAGDERDIDVESILAHLRVAEIGDLVDVRDDDTHVKIWVE